MYVPGIIITVSLIAALGIAVLENPQVQEWLEEQRRRLQELLRSLGEELDPESRRTAEAFAFEGRTPTNDEGVRREVKGSREAAAVATGSSMSGAGAVRRIPVHGPGDPDEAEERRRKGREYLARRNQQMHELQQKRRAVVVDGNVVPPSPTSFDAFVDEDGKLKDIEMVDRTVPSPPTVDPDAENEKREMREIGRQLVQPLLAGESSSSASAFQMGASLANPFSDEYEMDRSETPRPPVPPKVQLERGDHADTPSMPGSYVYEARKGNHTLQDYQMQLMLLEQQNKKRTLLAQQEQDYVNHMRSAETRNAYAVDHNSQPRNLQAPQPLSEEDHDQLSYEEQLAIALSLSEAESATAATVRQVEPEEDDTALRAAIAASLRDMDDQQAAHAIAHAGPMTPQPRRLQSGDKTPWSHGPSMQPDQPLVDLTPPSPSMQANRPQARNDWQAVFDLQFSPSHEPLTLAPPPPASEAGTDDLYRVTPELTRARLATLDAQQDAPHSSGSSIPYDPVREAAGEQQPSQVPMEASFYSAPVSPARSMTLERETPQLVEMTEAPPRATEPAPASESSTFGFRTDSESDTFASIGPSREQSRPRSEFSGVEVIDVVDDSDVDMLSEEGDGIVTPDSWTEVGSRDGESEAEEESRSRVAL